MSKPAPHVSAKKQKTVEELRVLLDNYPVIALIDMQNLPAPQLQSMKQSLRGKAHIRMTNGRLIKIVLRQSKQNGLNTLAEKIQGMPALLFTKENPFKLYKLLSANKSAAPAKPGQKAPKDVIVPEGKTSFAPGPILGELGQLGIKAGIEEGKVAIKAAKLLVKEGEVFTSKAAEVLTRLNILPMEVGLNILAVYENGTIFDKKILSIDDKSVLADLQRLHREAFALAIDISYASKDTITALIQKTYRDAVALADAKEIVTSENTVKLLAKAEAQAQILKTEAHLSE